MNRRLRFLPFAVLVALAAILGWRFGQPVDEGTLILRAATDYVAVQTAAGRAAAPTDCHGEMPGQRVETLVVYCQPASLPAGQVYEYRFDIWGRPLRVSMK